MTGQIVQLTAADFDRAMDVMNYAFRKAAPDDFANLLPKLYRPDDEHMSCHYAVVADDEIRAVVGVFPLLWKVGDATLRIGGIGGVSTHPRFRGQGLMQRLMEHSVATMREQGYHLSWLGGQRQRYANFGYEKCGHAISFKLNRRNLRDRFGGTSSVYFEEIMAGDVQRLTRVRELHNARSIRAERPESDLYSLLCSWSCRPYAALDNGEMVGYVVSSGLGGDLAELAAATPDVELEIARAWVEQGPSDGVSIELGPLAGGILPHLAALAEHTSVDGSGNWQVFDWVSVTKGLLTARQSVVPLPAGRVTLAIAGYGTLAIEVDADIVSCRKGDEPAMISCDSPLAHRLLFGPLPPSQLLDLPADAAALESWCPLPLFWPRTDNV